MNFYVERIPWMWKRFYGAHSQRKSNKPAIGKQGLRLASALLFGWGVVTFHTTHAAVGGPCSLPIANAESITRFLTHATFGPTKQDICDLSLLIEQEGGRTAGFAAWIDAQLNLPVTVQPNYFDPTSGNYKHRLARNYAWFDNALNAPDQLRHRMAFALSEIFVVSDSDPVLARKDGQIGLRRYYNMLLNSAFGDYESLLNKVTFHPVMGHFLSSVRSQAGDPTDPEGPQPDENYGREVLQLFSIGVDLLDLKGEPVLDESGQRIPAYDQETIIEFARAFTGLNYDLNEPGGDACKAWKGARRDFTRNMRVCGRYHDQGEKRLLQLSTLNTTLPAGRSGSADIRDAVKNIASHPNVPPFIAKRLIERFVTSNPSPWYVERVARAFRDSGGNLGTTVKAILLDMEAWRVNFRARNYGNKVREPLMLLSTLWRAFDGDLQLASHTDANRALFDQTSLSSPSVFNFFQSDYQPTVDTSAAPLPLYIVDEGLHAPELQIMTDMATIDAHNKLRTVINSNQKYVPLFLDDELSLITNTPTQLTGHLDQLLMAGRMSDSLRTAIGSVIQSRATQRQWSDKNRLLDILYLIFTAPEFAVQL